MASKSSDQQSAPSTGKAQGSDTGAKAGAASEEKSTSSSSSGGDEQSSGTKGDDKAKQSSASSRQQSEQATGETADALIKADHRRVEKLFEDFKTAGNRNAKQRLVRQICVELKTHTLIEEEIFYPACRGKVEDDLLDEAQVEHDGAKQLIVELQNGSPSDPYYDAKVTVLSEYIKHHVAEEEKPRDGIIEAARKAGVDMAALGQEIQAHRAEFERQAASTKAPEMPSMRDGTAASPTEDKMAQGYSNERGRSHYEDDDRGGRGGSGRGGSSRGEGRDEQGRFTSSTDNHRGGSQRSGGGSGRSGGSGWYGDPEGHSEASRRGWDHREGGSGGRGREDEDDRRYASQSRGGGGSSRYRDDEDDDRGGGRGGRDHGQGGWFGDPEGHSQASQRGWDHREGSGGGRGREDDDDRRYASQSRGGGSSRYRDDEDDGRSGRGGGRDHGQGGWFGDSQGHSEASRRGWEDREHSGSRSGGGDYRSSSQSGGGSSRYRDDEDDDRGGRGRGGRGQGGWFGDSEGHAEAARRGWQDR